MNSFPKARLKRTKLENRQHYIPDFKKYYKILIKKKKNLEDLEKRKRVYVICGECNESGIGKEWYQLCNAKLTSGNKVIDEFIQPSQLNAAHNSNCLEWVPYENFKDFTYITNAFGKI
ncbi:hypothetical protein RclHR1_10860004 [Rhizophagus clarus]|uniref:Kinase-like domain-containing protein n=1 Tax=Rhizophagus clarus TaxID=94130 RepID=A0A2Z6QHG6_9GLOM|nr:hypothetical protein RclHR1_10860004 [Rhizophagus clarus]GES91081.1 kinase-like domain-containing protein [Rhizophagus clarus]